MKQYHDLLQTILNDGDKIDTERTGVGTIATFGEQIKFDLRKGFPAVTTKKLAWRAVVSELIWFNKGSTDLNELRAILHGEENRFNREKRTIWDDNYNKQARGLGYKDGYMGEIYGAQWRNYGSCILTQKVDQHGWVVNANEYIRGVDQFKMVIKEVESSPQSRRLIVMGWNPKAVWGNDPHANTKTNQAALPPCHMLFQLNIVGDYIDLQWYQRSVDAFLGLPFNIASYALECHKFARILGKTPRYLVGALGNTHIYQNHVDQVKEQLSRDEYPLPTLWMNPKLKTLEDFENSIVDDFKLIDYQSHGTIKAPMAV